MLRLALEMDRRKSGRVKNAGCQQEPGITYTRTEAGISAISRVRPKLWNLIKESTHFSTRWRGQTTNRLEPFVTDPILLARSKNAEF